MVGQNGIVLGKKWMKSQGRHFNIALLASSSARHGARLFHRTGPLDNCSRKERLRKGVRISPAVEVPQSFCRFSLNPLVNWDRRLSIQIGGTIASPRTLEPIAEMCQSLACRGVFSPWRMTWPSREGQLG